MLKKIVTSKGLTGSSIATGLGGLSAVLALMGGMQVDKIDLRISATEDQEKITELQIQRVETETKYKMLAILMGLIGAGGGGVGFFGRWVASGPIGKGIASTNQIEGLSGQLNDLQELEKTRMTGIQEGINSLTELEDQRMGEIKDSIGDLTSMEELRMGGLQNDIAEIKAKADGLVPVAMPNGETMNMNNYDDKEVSPALAATNDALEEEIEPLTPDVPTEVPSRVYRSDDGAEIALDRYGQIKSSKTQGIAKSSEGDTTTENDEQYYKEMFSGLG